VLRNNAFRQESAGASPLTTLNHLGPGAIRCHHTSGLALGAGGTRKLWANWL